LEVISMNTSFVPHHDPFPDILKTIDALLRLVRGGDAR
jgi:hypothetical protein